jgi:nucleoside-diphosphate-sugar epimerase
MSAAGYQLRGVYGTEPYWPAAKLKICITGAGGFIASHLAKRLKEEGHYIVGCDWKRNEHMEVRRTPGVAGSIPGNTAVHHSPHFSHPRRLARIDRLVACVCQF